MGLFKVVILRFTFFHEAKNKREFLTKQRYNCNKTMNMQTIKKSSLLIKDTTVEIQGELPQIKIE